jgi:superfamily II RNA helicase
MYNNYYTQSNNMVKICNYNYPSENDSVYGEHFARFSYELSDFQKYAIEAIVDGHHSLITANTGSGKTLPAEFAIQHFTQMGKKVIYCSPIKALSNQKYYDFTQKYPHISFGILTGDIKTNPDASVLIMTTEILMNYLFKNDGSESSKPTLDFNIDINSELACVVFDEVHYINDPDRGKTWESCLIMLPSHVQLVMLSATIDNPAGFAKWVETGRHENVPPDAKTVYLSSTTHRIVPLTHYAFLTTIEGVFKGMKDKELEKEIRDNTNTTLLLQDANNNFNEQTFKKIIKMRKIMDDKKIHMKRQHVLNSLALHLRDRDMLPAIAFVFSRKKVEQCASEITVPLLEDDSKVSYIVRRECEQIIRKLPNHHEYLQLPEYNFVVSLLEKGIGIHHSGMLPILREIVEFMISKKYIKLLFATESFAIGLDCPIRTAIFTSLIKFDGENERFLHSHEYSQMAGRAGRRSIDKFGYVIHVNNLFDTPILSDYKKIMCGKPQKLTSKFHISYQVILNLIKNGQTCEFHKFAEKSMVYDELTQSIESQKNRLSELSEKIQQKQAIVHSLRTPYETCIHYAQLDETVKMLANKKRRETEREMQELEDEYSTIKADVQKVREYLQMQEEHRSEQSEIDFSEMFIMEQTHKITTILLNDGFISIQNENNVIDYNFTDMGTIASGIAEIHPLIMASFIIKNNYLAEFSAKELVGLFSCFTDVNVAKDNEVSVPCTPNSFLRSKINELKYMYTSYQQKEIDADVRTGIKYDNPLMYDIIDYTIEWCDCTTEYQCKELIEKLQYNLDVSIGDFTKAMLKIATISRELMCVCETMNQNNLLHKLSEIEGMILKYITTCQSLYI